MKNVLDKYYHHHYLSIYDAIIFESPYHQYLSIYYISHIPLGALVFHRFPRFRERAVALLQFGCQYQGVQPRARHQAFGEALHLQGAADLRVKSAIQWGSTWE